MVGGGFIALEFLNIFQKYGIATTLMVRKNHFFSGFLDEIGRNVFHDLFLKNDITEIVADEISTINTVENGLKIQTKKNLEIKAGFVAAGLGLERNLDFIGGDLKVSGGIRVNDYLETKFSKEGVGSPGSVFAAGDVVEYIDPFSGIWRKVANWTHGFMTGHIAGENMSGKSSVFRSVPSYSLTALGARLTFLGTVEESFADRTISFHNEKESRYARMFIKENRLVGSILINAFQAKVQLNQLIESGREVSDEELNVV